ncbi:hypothetical protein, partial [Streptomyces mirabilis]|uniref:hypothetical protein n=1 Tax=Streptomyces mirabilis TaxID=68239 RepID=UPI00371675A1
MPQSLGLGSQIQTALPLVQMREHHRELRVQYRQDFIRNRHNNPTAWQHRGIGPNPAVVKLRVL